MIEAKVKLAVENAVGKVELVVVFETILLRVTRQGKKHESFPLSYSDARELALSLNQAIILDDLNELLAKYKEGE